MPCHRARFWPAVVCLTALLAPIPQAALSQDQPAPRVVPVDGMRIERDTVLAPGAHVLERGIEIVADGVTLDGNGALLVGREHEGAAITANGRRNITIRNLATARFRHGIRLENCTDSLITACRIRGTHEIEPDATFLDIWTPLERAYGAGILLADCRDITVQDNDLQHQQNGLSMYACRDCTVVGNNASFCSGWGIHLNDSSHNVIRSNVADWCCRIYVRDSGGYHAGADAAALLLVTGSSANLVERNLFRGGGDGVFLAGYRHPDIKAPCDDNRFVENDCSLSPNNAFEATFSRKNRFERNIADKSNYGFWLGYSADTVVQANQIDDNRYAGVAIEHGRGNRIDRNVMRRNRIAVQLWTDTDPEFVSAFPELAASRDNQITGNRIDQGRTGIHIWTDDALPEPMCFADRILANRISGCRIGIRCSRAGDLLVRGNRIEACATVGMMTAGVSGLTVCDNYFDNAVNARAESGSRWTCSAVADEPQSNVLGGPTIGGNYWSDYAGNDADGDAIGDTDLPYRPQGVTEGGDDRPLVKPR